MARLLLVVGAGAAVALFVGCGIDTATQEQPDLSIRSEAGSTTQPAISTPRSPADLSIQRDLKLAIADDAELRDREISFTVSNGDVNVTGTVRTEKQRRKINDLVMNVGGVKSVANAILVAE